MAKNYILLSISMMKSNRIEIYQKQEDFLAEPVLIDTDTSWKTIKIVETKNSKEEQICTIYKTAPFLEKQMEQLRREIYNYQSIKTSKKFVMTGACMTSQGIALCRCRKKGEHFMSLKTFIQERKQIDFLKIFNSITKRVSLLHSQKIIHKHLSLDSIFSNEKGLLRMDFPLFTVIEKQQRKAGYFRPMIRPNFYYSPELRENQGFSYSSDIWALGIILLQILMKHIIDDCTSQLTKLILKLSEGYLKQLVKKMLHPSPLHRPTIQQIQKTLQAGKSLQSSIVLAPSQNILKIFSTSLFNQSSIQKRVMISETNKKGAQKKKFEFNIKEYIITIQLQSESQLLIFIENNVLKTIYLITIKNTTMPFSLRKYFTTVAKLYLYLSNSNRNHFVLTESGQLEFYHYTQKCLQLNKRIDVENRENGYQRNEMPFNCIGRSQSSNQMYSGSLIGPDLLLISAQALYNRQRNTFIDQIPFYLGNRFSSIGLLFSYPPQFLKCPEEEKYKYNYALVILEAKINLSNTLTLLYDYSEQIITNKISSLEFDIQFVYFVGNHQVSTEQIQFKKDKVHFNFKAVRGDPIVIKFSNGRVGVIGIVTRQDQGYLFSEQVRTNMLTWLFDKGYYEKSMIKNYPTDLPLRVFPTKSFDFFNQEIPYTIVQNIADTLLGSKLSYIDNLDDTILSKAIVIQSQQSMNIIRNESYYRELMKVLRSYQHQFGKNCWKTSVIYYCLGQFYGHFQPQKANYYFNKAIELQEKNQWNPLILLHCYYELNIFDNVEKIKYMDLAMVLGEKYHDYLVCGQIHRVKGQYYGNARKQQKCFHHFYAAIQSLNKNNDIQDLFNTLNSFIPICLQYNKWLDCAKSIQTMIKILSKANVPGAAQEGKRMINKYWSDLRKALKSRSTISAQIFEVVKRITKYYPQNSQILAILSLKVSKDN